MPQQNDHRRIKISIPKTIIILMVIILITITTSIAQRPIHTTDSLYITGKVGNPMVFTLTALDTFAKEKIDDQIIYNQKGEIKDTMREMQGVPIKNLLAPIKYI